MVFTNIATTYSVTSLFLCRPYGLTLLGEKTQVFGQIMWWFLLFLEYDFSVVYKPKKSHSIVDASSYLLAFEEPSGALDQIIDAPYSYSN